MSAIIERFPRQGVELSFRQRHAIREAVCTRAKRCGCSESDRRHAESAGVATLKAGASVAAAVQAAYRYLRGTQVRQPGSVA